jgi:hypothetical protein
MIVMKKEIYIRPQCNVLILEHFCDSFRLHGSGKSDDEQLSKEHSFTLEEETTTGWENE